MKFKTIFQLMNLGFMMATLIIIVGGTIRYISTKADSGTGTSSVLNATTSHIANSGQILFVSDRNGNYEIYKMDLATRIPENLTNNPGSDMNPQISPDGKFIVFYSDRVTTPTEENHNNEIYIMDLKTKEVKRLTDNNAGDYDPSYSPDGNTILFKSNRDDGYGDIFRMNTDGSDQINLTKERSETEEWDPTFTPDGEKIVFVSRLTQKHDDDELFRMNVDGTEVIQLTKDSVPDWYPSINPKTKNIVFTAKSTSIVADDLYETDETGTKRERLTTLVGNDDDASVSADGKTLVFINDYDGDYDLYIMDRATKSVERIENTPSVELSPVFIP